METTTNYNLKKYQSGDLFNPLTVNNPNLDDIDTDMKAISDRAIGRATELVSQGVHAITVLDTDCKTIKWVATANFTAGETFTINGIQCNAYLPSGEALGTNAYVSGAQVIGSLNDDNSAITIYVPQGTVAVASDSERLGGQLPSYYATKDYADGIKSTADNASELIGKKALVNTYYDSNANKLYQINADGTQGSEIVLGGFGTTQTITELELINGYTAPSDGFIILGAGTGSASYGYYAIKSSDNDENVLGSGVNAYAFRMNISGSGADQTATFTVKGGNTYTRIGVGNITVNKILFRPLHS